MSFSDAARLLDAADFAARKHKAQRRKDPEGTPYINHPIGVAWILAQEAGVTDVAVLQAALLHDTVEDTDTSLPEIEERFGQEVKGIVEEVTDDKALPKVDRKRLQVECAAQRSPAARLVKLADKLYNLRDLNRCTPQGESQSREIAGLAAPAKEQALFAYSSKVFLSHSSLQRSKMAHHKCLQRKKKLNPTNAHKSASQATMIFKQTFTIKTLSSIRPNTALQAQPKACLKAGQEEISNLAPWDQSSPPKAHNHAMRSEQVEQEERDTQNDV